MDIKDLTRMGLAQRNPLVKRDVEITYRPLKPEAEWADPSKPERELEMSTDTVTVFLRRYTATDLVAIATCTDDHERCFVALQRSVYSEQGAKLFPTMDDAYGVNLEVFAPLIKLIAELNMHAGKENS